METKKQKIRLDILLVESELFETRQKAQSAIMSGQVFVNNKQITKAGNLVGHNDNIEIKGEKLPFVGRGGLKLQKALKEFNIVIDNKVCIDAGASTGGFTDCLLQNGARLVYAVDVGYGQFDWKLRNDNRVKLLERTNIRYLTKEKLYGENINDPAEFCGIDLSFISVTKVLNNITNLMGKEKHIVILIKPQFEAGKEQVPKAGVVKDKSVHLQVIETILSFCDNIDLKMQNLSFSPITGSSGNIEYLTYLTNLPAVKAINKLEIIDIVDKAQQELAK